MIEHTDSIKSLMAALRKVQAELGGVVKDSANPFHKNKYASLEAVIDTIKRPAHEAGLVWTQAPGAVVNGALEITTLLHHDSGEWMQSTYQIPMAKVDPQGAGGACTYACRYALMAIFGLPPIDDDAETAHGRVSQPTKVARPVPPPPADVATSRSIAEDQTKAIRTAKSTKALEDWKELESTITGRARLSPADFETVKGEYVRQYAALKKSELLGAG
jgi:hypothetical protein